MSPTLGVQLKKTLEGSLQEGFDAFLPRYQRLLLRHAKDGAPYLSLAIETPSRHVAAAMLTGWLQEQGVGAHAENFGIDGRAVVVYLHSPAGTCRSLPQYVVSRKWQIGKIHDIEL